ncbi:hypothetical protein [Paludibacterium yongneupense]|uniref:hypothetical protein n=1 Tax=Paludibacterium yongneupense TaxID=400061 RepID=UPI0004279D01|nr:hypothetical protein [Paludibacterium yongneupense]
MPIQTKIIAALVSVGLLAGAAFLAYEHGYRHGFSVAQTQGDDTLSHFKLAQAQATSAALKTANDQYAASVSRANQAEQSLLDARAQLASQSQHAKEQIDAVTQTYRTAPDAPSRALPQCVFTRGFVRLWNQRAGAAAGDRSEPSGAATTDAVATTNAPDALDSGVSQADILDWFIDYTARNRSIESQLNQVLDVEQANPPTQPQEQ